MAVFVQLVVIICFKFLFVHSLGPTATLYLLFTNRVTRSVLGNTKPDVFCTPELARAVRKREGFVFLVRIE